jgi:hypothetical protein
MQRSRKTVVGLTAVVAAGAVLSSCTADGTGSSASSSAPPSTASAVPTANQQDQADPSTLHFTSLHNVRYCEIFLINPGTDATLVYNTTGLGGCPADQWKGLDPAKVASEKRAQSLFKNGPRYWVLDQLVINSTKEIDTFNGIKAKRWGATTISGSGGENASPPYTETLVNRPGSQWFYPSGSVVYQLVSPGGKTYVMQTYSQIVDPNLTIDDLPNLAYRLKLPSGWQYRTRILTQDLTTETDPAGKAHVLQDELQNSYQLLEAS